jgi:hypothetical protein
MNFIAIKMLLGDRAKYIGRYQASAKAKIKRAR